MSGGMRRPSSTGGIPMGSPAPSQTGIPDRPQSVENPATPRTPHTPRTPGYVMKLNKAIN